MRARVRDRLNLFDRPALPVGIDKILGLNPEEPLHLREPFSGVVDVMNTRRHGLAGRLVLERNTEIDDVKVVEHECRR